MIRRLKMDKISHQIKPFLWPPSQFLRDVWVRVGGVFALLILSSCGHDVDTPLECGQGGTSCVQLEGSPPPYHYNPPQADWMGCLNPLVGNCSTGEDFPQTARCQVQFKEPGHIPYYPEQTSFGSGQNGDEATARGGGCIMRPLREVWAVQITDPLMTLLGPDDGDSHVSLLAADAGNPLEAFRFNLHCHVQKVINVDWDILWTHQVKQGTRTKPQTIVINWGKVAGTSHILKQVGSIELVALKPGIVGFTAATVINAEGHVSAQDAENGLREALDKLRHLSPDFPGLPTHD